jgi:hypothetical protein
MATVEDVAIVRNVVNETVQLLDWCAGPAGRLTTEDGQNVPPVPDNLRASYAAAIDQLRAVQVEIALRTLQGGNNDFPMSQVLTALAEAGWDGPLLQFKLQVLEQNGRTEVGAVTGGGRTAGGLIRRVVFGRFTGALNAALDSLKFIPGVGAIKEVKDFLEVVVGR